MRWLKDKLYHTIKINMAYRLIVYRTDETKPHTHYFDDYETMEYSATMLQFSGNPHLVKVVAQEESPIEWKTLYTIG